VEHKGGGTLKKHTHRLKRCWATLCAAQCHLIQRDPKPFGYATKH